MSAIALHKDQQRKFSDEYFEGKQAGVSPLKQTGEGLLRDITIGVIGGGIASVILGRYSFVLGLGVAGYGHYSQNKMLSALGLGMMASGTFHALTGRNQDNKKSVGEKVTERFGAFKSEMKRKLWLDYFEERKGKKKNETNDVNEKEELNGTIFDHEEQLMNRPQTEKPDYFKKEKAVAVNVEDFPKMNDQEISFLEKKVDLAINREMKSFFENRQAVASYLETGEIPAAKNEIKKQNTTQEQVEKNFELHVQQAQSKSENKKSSPNVKADSYPDYEPEPQELIF